MAGQHYCLRWNNYQSNMTSVFHQLLQTEAFVDVTLACNEASLKAHKVRKRRVPSLGGCATPSSIAPPSSPPLHILSFIGAPGRPSNAPPPIPCHPIRTFLQRAFTSALPRLVNGHPMRHSRHKCASFAPSLLFKR
jgi:hypothetical protein